MKYSLLIPALILSFQQVPAQCTVNIYPDEFQPICYTWWGMYATQLVPWATEEPGWTYSWLPTAGLDNPIILHPMANPVTTTTYTLTASGPGCPPFIAGTSRVDVMPNTPTITPTGPINHHYSDTGSLVLSSDAAYGGWYKNGTLVQGCCNTNYTVSFAPTTSNYTDYYRYYSPYSCNYWSNTIEVTYIGCGICRVSIANDSEGALKPSNEKIKAMKELESIQIFPNPVASRLTVSSKVPVIEIIVTNIAGAAVAKMKASGSSPYSFNVDNLANGYYICTITLVSGTRQLPFIVRK